MTRPGARSPRRRAGSMYWPRRNGLFLRLAAPPPLRLAQWFGGGRPRLFGGQLGRGCLVSVAAQIGDDADWALGLARLAHIAAVQNQPVVCPMLVMRRGHRFETALDFERCL